MSALTGYQATIAETLGTEDEAMLALVETLMREESGGVLDSLGRVEFDRLARDARGDAEFWAKSPNTFGCALADYCATQGLTLPEELRTGATV